MTLWSVEVGEHDCISRIHPEIDEPESWLKLFANAAGLVVFLAAVILLVMR